MVLDCCSFVSTGYIDRTYCVYTIRRPFFEKRISQELEADFLGDEWKVRPGIALQECLCER